MKKIILCCLLSSSVRGLFAAAPAPHVLVYTRNYTPDGKGYVHDNIATGVALIKRLGQENGFAVEATDRPEVFTDANLKQYAALIFANSNNEAFENDAQRGVFRRFIEAGGGYVGIHSASANERTWPYYWSVVGGKFKRHSPLQKFTIQVIDTKNPATAHLGATWQWEDEFYLHDNLNPRAHILLAGVLTSVKDPELATYPGTTFGELFPLAWTIEENGGRRFYTSLGHKIEHYSDPNYQKHVLGGILWVLRMKD